MRFSKMLDREIGDFSLLEVMVIALVIMVLYLVYKSYKNNFGAPFNGTKCSDTSYYDSNKANCDAYKAKQAASGLTAQQIAAAQRLDLTKMGQGLKK